MSGATGGRAAHAKLQAARVRLMLEQPFIGALLLHLPMVESARCATIGTDGRQIEFDAGYIASLTLRQTQFVLAHQTLHCALGHFARRAHRVRRRWDAACDLAVNQLLLDEGMEPPPGASFEARYRGLSAEEIYPLLADTDVRARFDVHLFDRTAGSGAGAARDDAASRERVRAHDAAAPCADEEQAIGVAMTPAASEELAQRWQMRLATAAQQVERVGRLGTSWRRAFARMLRPAPTWNAVLARHVLNCARDDYSFMRPSRREGAAILPRLHIAQLELFVAVDTSGSVSESQLGAFAAEIEAIKSQVRARVTLHACDEQLASDGPWVFEAWESLRLPATLKGGAGTDFRPVFDWIRGQMHRPDLLLYFTDAQGDFPSVAPSYPVIWLVKGPAPVPWGERIQLN